MLRGPVSNIRLTQITYVILISICVSGSILVMVNALKSPTPENFIDDPFMREEVSFDIAAARFLEPSSLFNNVLGVLLPLIIASIIIVTYIPTGYSLGISKSQSQSKTKRFPLSLRGFSIPINGSHIEVTRKLSSIRGLLLRELNFTVYLPLDFPDEKRIFDFLVGEKIKYTEDYILLQKTVDIRNIPLLIVRMRALLDMTTIGNNQ